MGQQETGVEKKQREDPRGVVGRARRQGHQQRIRHG